VSDTCPGATPGPEIYRRMINWTRRLAREGPFLEESLGLGAGVRVLDLGCGTGEHDRWLAERGARVVAVDRSPDMLATARAAAGDAAIEYVEASIDALPERVIGPFDAAICLGNTLVHLADDATMRAALAGVAVRLRSSGRLLVQILNYHAIVAERRRAMPPSIQPTDDGGEMIVLRLMDHPEPGWVVFEVIGLERRGDEPPVVVLHNRSRLRAWTRAELVPLIEAEIGSASVYGGMRGEPYDVAGSSDLVVVAERR